MATNQRQPLIEIDLNVDATYSGIDSGDGIQEKLQFHLPDLNIEATYLVPDLNFSPNSPSIEVSSSGHFVLDLNSEPFIQADTEPEAFFDNENTISNENSDVELSQAQTELRKCWFLSNDDRMAIWDILLQQSANGKLRHGVTKLVAEMFLANVRTVQRIWKLSKSSDIYVDVSDRRKRNSGRKRVEIDWVQFREVPLHQRTTLASLSCSLNMSKTTLFRRLKSGDIRRHTNATKPFLKEENKKSRLQFCISMLDESSIPHGPIFVGMHNIIHIDEKWFYMTKKSENYYLLPDEEDPILTCKSKNFIGKVMFLVALARPRFDAQGNELFLGKIGVFPFDTQESAKRNSVNRVAGTLETKPITSVKREVIRAYLIEKILPSIKEKWPKDDLGHPIFIQQDNARTHIGPNDDEFCRVATQDGFDIRLMSQPPNSPDLNVLDLGVFSAIQSLQYKASPKTVDELINAVVKSFEDFSTIMSNHIFLKLQLCMIEIMKAKGSHRYKIPHMKKAMLESESRLPTQIKCDPALVQEILNYIM